MPTASAAAGQMSNVTTSSFNNLAGCNTNFRSTPLPTVPEYAEQALVYVLIFFTVHYSVLRIFSYRKRACIFYVSQLETESYLIQCGQTTDCIFYTVWIKLDLDL